MPAIKPHPDLEQWLTDVVTKNGGKYPIGAKNAAMKMFHVSQDTLRVASMRIGFPITPLCELRHRCPSCGGPKAGYKSRICRSCYNANWTLLLNLLRKELGGRRRFAYGDLPRIARRYHVNWETIRAIARRCDIGPQRTAYWDRKLAEWSGGKKRFAWGEISKIARRENLSFLAIRDAARNRNMGPGPPGRKPPEVKNNSDV